MESWAESSADGAPAALLRLIPGGAPFSLQDNETDSSRNFQSGMTFQHSTANLGGARSTSSPEDSRVSHSRAPREGAAWLEIDGRTCSELSEKFSADSSSPRTSNENPSSKRQRILKLSGMTFAVREFRPPPWLPHIGGSGSGWLPTPTATANPDCPSMQKWPGHRLLRRIFGERSLTPQLWEWMMGWPIGWSDLRPLEMGKFQAWLRSHGIFSLSNHSTCTRTGVASPGDASGSSPDGAGWSARTST